MTVDPWRWFTAEKLVTAAEVPVENVRDYWPRLVAQMELAGIADDLDVYLALIGTVAKESRSQFTAVREAYWLDDAARWAEYERRGYDGGPNYHGRGGIQHTHLYNYRALGPKIAALWNANPAHPDFDLVSDPDRLLDVDFSAAADVIFFRDKRALPTAAWPAGYSLLDAARARDWEWVRKLVYGGRDVDGEQRLARIAAALTGATAPRELVYNASQPPERQIQNWACSIRAATWALKSVGIGVDAGQMQDEMVPGTVTPSAGLLDARGYGLAAAIGRHLPAGTRVEVVERATWADLEARAGRGPICLGSSDPRLYHWINVARQRADGDFDAPNPAPNHPAGAPLGDVLTPAACARYAGSWSLVFVEVEPAVSVPAPAAPDLGTLVGVAYADDGVVVPALVGAQASGDWGQVDAVVKFLRAHNPNRAA